MATQKSTTFSNVKISYTTYNLNDHNSSEPVLCFIHGWCCSSALWTFQSGQADLYTNHPSILIDLPGCGESDKPEDIDYSPEFFARSIISVLQAEGVDKVVLLGHSFGGFVCTMVLRLLNWPDSKAKLEVKGIVYVDSFWLAPAQYRTHAQRQAWGGMMKDDERFFAIFESGFTEKSSPAIREKIRHTMAVATPMHVRLGMIQSDSLAPHWKWDEVYDGVPMLHIQVKGQEAWDEQHRRHFPRLVTERWEGVSHFLFMEVPEDFNRRVDRFLEENGLR